MERDGGGRKEPWERLKVLGAEVTGCHWRILVSVFCHYGNYHTKQLRRFIEYTEYSMMFRKLLRGVSSFNSSPPKQCPTCDPPAGSRPSRRAKSRSCPGRASRPRGDAEGAKEAAVEVSQEVVE